MFNSLSFPTVELYRTILIMFELIALFLMFPKRGPGPPRMGLNERWSQAC